jgi:hypothetical protein
MDKRTHILYQLPSFCREVSPCGDEAGGLVDLSPGKRSLGESHLVSGDRGCTLSTRDLQASSDLLERMTWLITGLATVEVLLPFVKVWTQDESVR